jgi:hypothetical protein
MENIEINDWRIHHTGRTNVIGVPNIVRKGLVWDSLTSTKPNIRMKIRACNKFCVNGSRKYLEKLRSSFLA